MKAQIISFIIIIAVLNQGTCQDNFSESVQEQIADSGIQISYTEQSFTNIFAGVADIIQDKINDQSISSKGKIFSLFVTNVNLTQFQLNTNSSYTNFISDKKTRVVLNFDCVNATFNYKLVFFNTLPILDSGYITDNGLQIHLDISISSNPNGTTHFGVSHLDIQPGNIQAQLNNKIFNFFAKLFFDLCDSILSIFKYIADLALEILLNKVGNQIPTSVKIPKSDVVLDLSLKGQPFLQNGYMNIPISGNSYISGTTPTDLHPFRQFNTSQYASNSTQIFIDQRVVNRIVETFISKQLQFNISLPQVSSSTTPVDSRSLSAVFPGLRKLKVTNYPIFEAIVNQTSVKFHFKNNQLQANAVIGLNLYMMEPNKPETTFKYNNEVVYIQANISLNILNSKNYLTINVVNVNLKDVIVSPKDASLVDVKQIKSIFPFFDQVVNDAINIETYQIFLDLSKVLGFEINRVDINFEENNIHLDVIF